jgi:hypothetical protein
VGRETEAIVKGEGEIKKEKEYILNNQVKLFCKIFFQHDKREIKKITSA